MVLTLQTARTTPVIWLKIQVLWYVNTRCTAILFHVVKFCGCAEPVNVQGYHHRLISLFCQKKFIAKKQLVASTTNSFKEK